MSDDIRLNPPSGLNAFSLVSLSGHSLCIHRINPLDGEPGTPTPVKFRKDAFAAGCSVVGVDVDESEEDAGGEKAALILKALESVVERNSPDEVDANGRPKLAAVKKEAGFGVTKVELDAAFTAFEASLA